MPEPTISLFCFVSIFQIKMVFSGEGLTTLSGVLSFDNCSSAFESTLCILPVLRGCALKHQGFHEVPYQVELAIFSVSMQPSAQ
jgi:hypothetical protein